MRRSTALRRGRSWLVDYGIEPRRVRTMTPRQVRREVDATFGPSGFRGFKRWIRRSPQLVPDFTRPTGRQRNERDGGGGAP